MIVEHHKMQAHVKHALSQYWTEREIEKQQSLDSYLIIVLSDWNAWQMCV